MSKQSANIDAADINLIHLATKNRHVHADRPSCHFVVKRLQRLKRRRSSHGLKVDASDPLQKLQDMDEDFHVGKNMSALCVCWSCQYLRQWSTSLQPYRCNFKLCMIEFESFIDMYEHQLEIHGCLNPKTNRVVNDTFHQQQGTLAFPPATVYAAQQFMVPSRPPTPWKSTSELDDEAKIVRDKLWTNNPDRYGIPYRLFKAGYQLVKRNGWKEMQRQFQIAMEHYYSGLRFLASSRGFRDGCPSIERGRNWLTSTDREDICSLFPFGVNDKVDVEPEFVLIDTKHDQEMQERIIVLSDDSEDEIVVVNANKKKKKKIERGNCDVKSKVLTGGKFSLLKNRKLVNTDSDARDVEPENGKGDKENTLNKHDVVDLQSDDNAAFKSRRCDDSETDSNFGLDVSRPAYVDNSDRSSESDDEERHSLKATPKSLNMIISVSDSESTSENEFKSNAFNNTADSDSETSSDSDSHSDDNHGRDDIIASEASRTNSGVKLISRDKYVSDTESESESLI